MTSQFPHDILMDASENPSYYELNMYFISSLSLSLSFILNFLYLSLSIFFFRVLQFNPILTDKLFSNLQYTWYMNQSWMSQKY